jgi:hypothetical protein
MNTCDYELLTCLTMSSSTTTSQTSQHQTDTSTVRTRRECTAYNRLESLPSNCLRNNYKNMDTTKVRQPWFVETRHRINFLHPCCQQLWGKTCGERERTAPTRHCVTVLQVFIQLERLTILWTHHQVGLQWTKSPPINAQLLEQSSCPFLAPSLMKATELLNYQVLMVLRTLSKLWAIWNESQFLLGIL